MAELSRGVPARPRKASTPVTPYRSRHAAPDPEPKDPRIGLEVAPTATAIGYSDGTEYRCENGKIVERVR